MKFQDKGIYTRFPRQEPEAWYQMLQKVAVSYGLNREEAQDVAQEAVFAYYRVRQAPPWADKQEQPILLKTILHGCIVNSLRKTERETALLGGALVADPVADVEHEAIQHCVAEEIIETIPIDYRLLVYLRIFEELSWREISEQIGKPIGTVSVQFERALKTARKKLGVDCRKMASSSDSINSGRSEEVNHDLQASFDGNLSDADYGESDCFSLNFFRSHSNGDGGGDKFELMLSSKPCKEDKALSRDEILSLIGNTSNFKRERNRFYPTDVPPDGPKCSNCELVSSQIIGPWCSGEICTDPKVQPPKRWSKKQQKCYYRCEDKTFVACAPAFNYLCYCAEPVSHNCREPGEDLCGSSDCGQ